MAMSHLGTPVDVHGGGQDLVFPHHENEIAQTESYDEQRALARFWVHNGLLRIGDETMSKSLGNFRHRDRGVEQLFCRRAAALLP